MSDAASGAEVIGPLAAIDPGRSKCGLVLTDGQQQRVVESCVLPPEASWERLKAWHRQAPLVAVVLGDGTSSGPWQARLAELCPVLLIDERGTTLAARERFWQLEPPRGWRRLVPKGLRLPPRDWDDVVAHLLLERHLGRLLERIRTLREP